MKNKFKVLLSLIFFGLILIGCDRKEIKASEIVDVIQSNYLSIEINDKKLEAGSNKQYLIDDFIPRLSKYTLKTYDGEFSKDYSYKVIITYKDNSEITLIDNKYLMINDTKYEIIKGNINFDKFYNFIK
ncbi:hypothetical protein [Clostridium polynesiense]|uniref:hypothetical protein n=1 Tax=Clostridium polynesiense TaxID=1325933 RepID=UPI00058F690F|nr:hypothetical protein [Clostridium polynesiense]